MNEPPPGDDLRSDPDIPGGIRYDPDLAVHEPMEVPASPSEPSRRRSPLVLFPIGLLVLALAVYILFGLIANEGKTSSDYLEEIRFGRGGARNGGGTRQIQFPVLPRHGSGPADRISTHCRG